MEANAPGCETAHFVGYRLVAEQTYWVCVTSAASSVPLPLVSRPLFTTVPPLAQLVPAGSVARLTSACRPGAPVGPASPGPPWAPLQT